MYIDDSILERVKVRWNKYMRWTPTPKQLAFLMYDGYEMFLGGSAGGGKAQCLTSACNASILGYNPEDPKQMEDFRMKCGQHVITPFGLKLIDDVQVGDAVVNPDGTTCNVIGVHPPTMPTCYKVEVIEGASCIVGEDHLWSVKRSGMRPRAKVKSPYHLTDDMSCEQRFNTELVNRYRTVTTLELKRLFDLASAQKEKGTRPNWPLIPLTEPVNFQLSPGKGTKAPPYLLGVWLGDGHCSNGQVGYTKPSKVILERMKDEAALLGDEIRTADDGIHHKFVGKGLLLSLESMHLDQCKSHDKFIPTYYKFAPIEVRKQLLKGLMDSDGYADDDGAAYYTSTSERLINDICFLARSLGYTTTKSYKAEPKYTYKGETRTGRPAWTIYFSGRNRDQLFEHHELKSRRSSEIQHEGGRRVIRMVKMKHKLEARCITVSHSNGLYLTNDFIVTHNSAGLVLSALQYCDVPGYSAILFRKTLGELKGADGIVSKIDSLLAPFLISKEVKYVASEHAYYFKTTSYDGTPGQPARLELGYIGVGNAKIRYQGSAFAFVGFDEVTHHHQTDYEYMFSRLRKPVCPIHQMVNGKPNYEPDCGLCRERSSIPLRVRSASNPGNIGHSWVRKRFKIEPHIPPEEAEKQGIKIRWIGKDPERPYLPARLSDNPYLDQEGYLRGLSQLDPETRKQLEDGDWGDSSTTKFRRSWFNRYSQNGNHYILGPDRENQAGVFSAKEMRRIWLSVDPAASSQEGVLDQFLKPKDEPSWTVISVFGLTPNYHLLWMDMDRFQEEVPEVIRRVIMMWNKWSNVAEYALIENRHIGLGVLQECARSGVPVKAAKATQDKVVRATPAIRRAEIRRIWLPQSAHWLKDVEDELFTWQGYPNESDDIIDTLAHAVNDVDWPDDKELKESYYHENLEVIQEGISYVEPHSLDLSMDDFPSCDSW